MAFIFYVLRWAALGSWQVFQTKYTMVHTSRYLEQAGKGSIVLVNEKAHTICHL